MNTILLKDLSYETRNLSVPSFELSENTLTQIDEDTLKICLDEKYQEYGSFFTQCRISKTNLKYAHILSRCGFYFVEVIVSPQTNFKKNLILQNFIENKSNFIPKKYKYENFKLLSLNKSDLVQVEKIKIIAQGSFSDDRFHLDFNCPKQIADQRFSFWVDDLLNNEKVTFDYLSYLDNEIAFFARNEDNLILAGFASNYVNSGLGDFFWLSVLEKMMLEGYKNATTVISINNTPVLNLYSRIGFKYKFPLATFHYWSSLNY
ncbi:hypothetical protein ACN4EE_05625 [Geminocystis sp. CENA526]|uniref:hypothetical protein n=1 Tax=Geminocystis sp. CENA526 TaxID=1355871 RepID=UPI003D6E46D6